MEKKYVLIVSSVLFVSLFSLASWIYWRQSYVWNDLLIADHVEQLASILNKIHDTAKIISFEHQQNYIDFLNVISFEGSEVGPMNLAYPQKWQGPYLKDNPTIQEKYYQVVRTQKGYFVVPGPGVTLSNGKIIGKDIIFHEDADIEQMIHDDTLLRSHDRPLAAPIMRNNKIKEPTKEVDDRMLRERLKNL